MHEYFKPAQGPTNFQKWLSTNDTYTIDGTSGSLRPINGNQELFVNVFTGSLTVNVKVLPGGSTGAPLQKTGAGTLVLSGPITDNSRAITLGAAELLRIDERVGSIEVGKDADLVITDGPLLHYLSLPQYTIVNGRVAYDQDEAGVLDHVRRDGRPEPEVIREPWPRRLGDPF